MGKKYLDTKKGSLEQSILGVWQMAAEEMEVKIDGRTKKYREHRAKLETARQRREATGDKEKYQKFFNAAMKKFGVDSPADFKSDAEKKKFFNYVDKNYKGDHEEEVQKLHKELFGLEEGPFSSKSSKIQTKVAPAVKTFKSKEKPKSKKEGLEDKTDNPANSQHMCAKNVVHEEWGYGQCIPTMHADPDENGDVAWYDVMFEHGIEKGVSISELIVEKSEEHMHASVDKKKNKKEEVKESYEIGTDEYREYTQELTPGQEIEKYGSFKVSSMKEALAKVWGLEEKRLDKTEEDDKIAPVKGDKTMTGGKVAKVEVDPDTKKEK